MIALEPIGGAFMRFSQDDGWAIIRFRRARRSRPLNVSNFAQSLPWYGRSFAGAGGSSSFSLMQGTNMYMSGQSLLITLLIGLTAGWVAGQIVQGAGFGIIRDLLIGIVGAFIGSWLLPQLGVHLGLGIIAAIINATIGALMLLFVIRIVRGGGGWRGSWGRRW
jgi:uncharacterized membrane protein YeaQ/YmgE (transglycosylase-associated protein family)